VCAQQQSVSDDVGKNSQSQGGNRRHVPRPAPSDAPFTMPAMSTNSIAAGTTFSLLLITPSLSNRLSGTLTMPTFGSIVQKGKLAACAVWLPTKALNKVLFPTLGSPTMPVCSFIVKADVDADACSRRHTGPQDARGKNPEDSCHVEKRRMHHVESAAHMIGQVHVARAGKFLVMNQFFLYQLNNQLLFPSRR